MQDKHSSNFFGTDLPESGKRSSSIDQLKLLRKLCPQPAPVPLIRIGPGQDGTYIVPDDLTGITACFSPGTNNFKDFEDVLTHQYEISAFMYDGANEADSIRTPLVKGKQSFEKLWLDVDGTENSISLDDWVARHQPNSGDDLMLQIDIEGAEYRNLLACSDETLKRFRIIVIEVHGLDQMVNDAILDAVLLPFFERLNQYHTCVHAHPNNYFRPFHIPDLEIYVPPLLELTFLRDDRFERKDRFEVELPHPLDIRSNVRTKPPVFLDDFFRGRPPSEKESLQMLEVRSSWQFQEEAQLLEERSNLVIEKLKSEKEKFIRERDVALSERNAAFAERDIALAERDTYRRKLAHVIRYPWKHADKFIRRKKTNV